MTGWKIIILYRRYIFKRLYFHWHVIFRGWIMLNRFPSSENFDFQTMSVIVPYRVISVDFNLFEDLSEVSTFDIPLLTQHSAPGEIPSRSRYGLEALSVGVAFEDALRFPSSREIIHLFNIGFPSLTSNLNMMMFHTVDGRKPGEPVEVGW